jgi:hypothetical protein
MSKSEVLHELYNQCKDINFDESFALMKEANSREEEEFFRVVTDFVLQQKQQRVIAEKRF